jgi:hypothetical protein
MSDRPVDLPSFSPEPRQNPSFFQILNIRSPKIHYCGFACVVLPVTY